MRMPCTGSEERDRFAYELWDWQLLLPLESTAFQFVDQACDEDEGKEEHGPQDVNSPAHEIAMSENPGNEENDVYVKQDEKHGRYVKLDRVAGLPLGVGHDPAFVRGILDLSSSCLLPERMTGHQNANPHPNSQDDLNKHG